MIEGVIFLIFILAVIYVCMWSIRNDDGEFSRKAGGKKIPAPWLRDRDKND